MKINTGVQHNMINWLTRPLLFITLLCTASLAHAANGDERIQQFFTEVKSLRADFEQTVTDSKGKVIQDAKGTFVLQRPGKFRWDYRAPYPQLIVADGRKLWIYDPDLEQVTVKQLDSVLGSTPAQLLSGARFPQQDFTVISLGTRNSLDWVELTPKANEKDFEKVQLGFDQRDLRMMTITDNFGNTTHLKFNNLQRNPTIEASAFVFTPPKGADVVGE